MALITSCRSVDENLYTEYKAIDEIKTEQTSALTSIEDGKFYFPKFTANGNKAVFTTEDYSGLWYYDFETKVINQLNPSIGAGIDFDISHSGEKVYFRLQSTSAKGDIRNYSIAEQDLDTKVINILYTSQNYISAPKSLIDGNISFLQESKIIILNCESKNIIENHSYQNIIAFADSNSIVIKFNETEERVYPVEDGVIQWVDVSAKNDKIYFTSSIKGTGVYIVESKEVKWIDNYKYINCSPVSNLFVFTFYENYNYELFISTDDYKSKYNFTESANENEIFPYWSSDGTKVIFNTANGIIKMAKLKIISGNNV